MCLFFFDSLRPSQQVFSHVGMDHSGLNQSCSMAQLSASREARTHNPLITNQALYHLASDTLHRAVDFEGKVGNVVGRRKENEKKSTKLSHNMRVPTMWYVRPAKPQISLRIRAV